MKNRWRDKSILSEAWQEKGGIQQKGDGLKVAQTERREEKEEGR